MKLGDQLKELLKNEPKQAAIASALGVAAPTLSQWLSGAELCNPAQLSRIVTEYIKDATTDKEAELLRLLLLLTGDRIERDKHDAWTEDGRKLALAAVRRGLGLLESRTPRRAPGKRTLADFPDSFYPLAVISGDKREVSQSRINFADFGAVSSSPAETRWILRLGLRPVSDKDLQFFTDKVCVVEAHDKLKKRFGKMNLLVIGSPGSNHLARRCHHYHKPPPGWRRAAPLFRFNLPTGVLEQIEQFIKGLEGLNKKQLVGKQGEPDTEEKLKYWLHDLFHGGILDPAYQRLRGREVRDCDYGLVTLARNPFADSDEYVCIMAAGFHMFGTAHALKMLVEPKNFANHPLGGVIRVDYDQHGSFAERFDSSSSEWDMKTLSNYTIEALEAGIKQLKEHLRSSTEPQINVTPDELDECLDFIRNL